jgi:hypothetical protein
VTRTAPAVPLRSRRFPPLIPITAIIIAVAPLGRAQETSPPQQADESQPESQPPHAAPGPARLADLQARLEGLAPGNPEAYFLLAEEVAQEAIEPEGVALARQLLLSAYHLESRAAGPRGDLLASICLLAAELERVDATAAWLRALAGALDPRHAAIDWNVSAAPAVTGEAALGAVHAISLTLAGEGVQAAELLQRPDVRAVLRRYEALLSVTGLPGGLARLERYARLWPCRECRNTRSTTRVGPDGPETVLCPTCRGNPGPQLAEEEYLALLRFQARLLDGIHESWSAQIITSAGAPLLDPDPGEFVRAMSQRYGIDPAAVVYQDGKWRREEGE